jgi:hypothetical protein
MCRRHDGCLARLLVFPPSDLETLDRYGKGRRYQQPGDDGGDGKAANFGTVERWSEQATVKAVRIVPFCRRYSL